MNIYEKIRQRIFENKISFTLSYDNALPMLIVSSDEAKEIIDGNLQLNPAADVKTVRALTAKLPSKYKGVTGNDMIEAGGCINYSGLAAKQLSLYPLPFKNGRFERVDRKLLKIADTAVVITNPQEFMIRVQRAINMGYANRYVLAIMSAQYKKIVADPQSFSIFEREKKDRWKREILLTAGVNPSLQIVELKEDDYVEPMKLYVGELSDIAEVCPLRDLVSGKHPEILSDQRVVEYMESYAVPEKEIRHWCFSAAGKIQNLMPTNEWIEKLAEIFPADEWKACSIIDRLYQDGEAMPRLAFYRINGFDKIYLRINRFECHFDRYEKEQETLLKKLIHFVAKECDTTFCHMSAETQADLGVVADKRFFAQTHFREERISRKETLFEAQYLGMEYRLFPSVFGAGFSRRDWHYVVRLFTPNYEDIMWYDSEAVIDFFAEASESNVARIAYLMKGNAYDRYHKT